LVEEPADSTSVTVARPRTEHAGFLRTLVAEEVIEPIDTADELGTRCPCCEHGRPNRYVLTIRLRGTGPQYICRAGCVPERIGERLHPTRTLGSAA
jgi:hypothetical protein